MLLEREGPRKNRYGVKYPLPDCVRLKSGLLVPLVGGCRGPGRLADGLWPVPAALTAVPTLELEASSCGPVAAVSSDAALRATSRASNRELGEAFLSFSRNSRVFGCEGEPFFSCRAPRISFFMGWGDAVLFQFVQSARFHLCCAQRSEAIYRHLDENMPPDKNRISSQYPSHHQIDHDQDTSRNHK